MKYFNALNGTYSPYNSINNIEPFVNYTRVIRTGMDNIPLAFKLLNPGEIKLLSKADYLSYMDDLAAIGNITGKLDAATALTRLKAIDQLEGLQSGILRQLNVPKPNTDPIDLNNFKAITNDPDVINFTTLRNIGDDVKHIDTAGAVKVGFKNADEANGIAKNTDDLMARGSRNSESFFNRLQTLVAKNPYKTVGAFVALTLGGLGIAYVLTNYENSNNKTVSIITSYAGPASSHTSSSSNIIVIEYKSDDDATIVTDDGITISDDSFIPSLNGQKFKVISVTDNKITINVTNKITTYATSGKLLISTTLENRMLNGVENVAHETGSIVRDGLGVGGDILGEFFGPIFESLKPALVGCGMCIAVVILLFIVFSFLKK